MKKDYQVAVWGTAVSIVNYFAHKEPCRVTWQKVPFGDIKIDGKPNATRNLKTVEVQLTRMAEDTIDLDMQVMHDAFGVGWNAFGTPTEWKLDAEKSRVHGTIYPGIGISEGMKIVVKLNGWTFAKNPDNKEQDKT